MGSKVLAQVFSIYTGWCLVDVWVVSRVACFGMSVQVLHWVVLGGRFIYFIQMQMEWSPSIPIGMEWSFHSYRNGMESFHSCRNEVVIPFL